MFRGAAWRTAVAPKAIKINISGLDFKTWSTTIDKYPDSYG